MPLSFLDGQLKKLEIKAYTDIDCKDTSFTGKSFKAMFNPDKYTKNLEILTEEKKGTGKSGGELIFKGMKPQEYTFEFLIDGTGAVGGDSLLPIKVNVTKEIEKFTDTVYKYDGKTHRPHYLKLLWGDEISKCVFQKASVNYTMFKPDGKPLRATINATFVENISDKLRQAIDKTSSPDLTHKRAVKEGDHLLVMTYGIYETLDPVIQVAKANDLDTIRAIPPGVNLLFPPLEDEEA